MLQYRSPPLRLPPVPTHTIRCRPLPERWTESLTLPDGRQMTLRPIVPDDAEPLRAGFTLLRPDEVRMRFMYAIKELTPDAARRLTSLDPRREFALVVAEPLPPGEALIAGVVRASVDESGHAAEFAILVSHFIAGQGVGRLLMKRIIRWARLKRLDELYGDVLEDNASMLLLTDSLGFLREYRRENPGLIRVRLPLR